MKLAGMPNFFRISINLTSIRIGWFSVDAAILLMGLLICLLALAFEYGASLQGELDLTI